KNLLIEYGQYSFFFQAEDGIRYRNVTGVQTCALPISKYREKFSVVTARAVARMSVLSELCLPLCKVGGSFIALKGANAHEEMKAAANANKILGGETVAEHTLHLPIENSERT